MVALLMHRRGETLVPADRMAAEDLAKLPLGRSIAVEAKRARSVQHNRLFFALLRKVVENMDGVTENALRSWLKVQLGYVEHMPLGFGRSYAAPSSMSFDAMPQDEFNAFFDKSVALICSEVIPGLGKPELLAEVEAMLGADAMPRAA